MAKGFEIRGKKWYIFLAMDKTDILVFDVGLGQSVFVYSHMHPTYGMLIDCGNTPEFDPVDFLIAKGYLPNNSLSKLVITNYDQDHFSGMPNLRSKVGIRTVMFAPNLTSPEIKDLKEKPHTDALVQVCEVKDTYIHPIPPDFVPPYIMRTFYLQKAHLDGHTTNNLSQIVFIEHQGTVVCVSGDLEEKGWKALLVAEPEVKTWLARTNIFIASHHGRENGYHPDVFLHCKPECIIISDKDIVHETQEAMSSVYAGQVVGNGVSLNGLTLGTRKVLTTRSDGHLYIQLFPGGTRAYSNFSHE